MIRYLIAITSILFILSANTLAQALSIEANLISRVNTANKALENELAKILREKRSYTKKINQLQTRVNKLSDQANNLQRLADEKLVSLENLKIRSNKWEEQLNYQTHLLSVYEKLIQSTSKRDEVTNTNFSEISVLEKTFEEIESRLNPNWKKVQLATQGGNMIAANTLALGPHSWFLDVTREKAGLFEFDPITNENIAFYTFSESQRSQLQDLLGSNIGIVSFDPTLGRAVELINNKETLFSHIHKGGIWVFPILFFGMISLAIAVIKFVQILKLKKYTEDVVQNIQNAVEKPMEVALLELKQHIKDHRDPLLQLANTVVKMPPSNEREDLLFSQLNNERHKVEKYLDVISIVTAVAPLLGLLGTVSGMINTFKMLTVFGSGDPAAISGGISEALVTTELGLIVAIPSLVINALLSRKVKSHVHGLETHAITLNNLARHAHSS